MSRRKQSNPKPLKRGVYSWCRGRDIDELMTCIRRTLMDCEDVWGSDEEGAAGPGAAAGAAPRSPSAASGGASSRGDDDDDEVPIKMETCSESAAESAATGDTEHAASPPPILRLRLNTSLATDPAQRKDNSQAHDRSSPDDRGTRPDLDLLPGAAFPSVPVSSPVSNLFCLPPNPDTNHVLPAGTPTLRVKQEVTAVEPPPPPPRQVANCYMCQPCGIRFSSKSTLEAHQTFYCSHRPSAIAAASALQSGNTRSSSPSVSVPGSGKGDSDGELGSPRSGGPAADEDAPAAKAPRTGRQYACPHCSYSADKKVSLNRHMRMHAPAAPCPSPSPVTPMAPSDSENTADEGTGSAPLPPPPLDRYCADCDIRFSSVKTYRAHKMHYCSTRHVVKPPSAVSPAAASQASSGAEERLQVRGSSASSPAGSPPASASSAAQPFLALPTTPVLLVPYQLVQAASLVSSHALPPGAATAAPGSCLLLVDGAIRPLTLPTCSLAPPPPVSAGVAAPPPPPPTQRPPPQVEQQTARVPTPSSGSPAPLDLSVPRSGSAHSGNGHPPSESPSPRPRPPDPEDEKENRGLNNSSPSLCSSPASSPSSASPRPARQNGILPSVSKKSDTEHSSSSPTRKTPTLQGPTLKTPKQPVMLPELLGPLLGTHLALLPGALTSSLLTAAPALNSANHIVQSPVPQILVKQGVSRCAECNIVFCKMENYMAHKKHYCSARRTEESSSPENGVVTAKSASPAPRPGQAQAATPPIIFPNKALLQYICAACGIKFTSLDNLKAHQKFYCLKRDVSASNTASTNNNEPPPERKKCPKCKVILPTDESASPHQCVITAAGGGNSWRCPCCGVSSPTATAAQKHLEEAHAGVLRAFRCTICRYRGNTLRGMRTHIRMHFSAADKAGDMREEDYIACVLSGEPEPRPVEEEQPASPERDEANIKSIGSMERNHTCDQCNYSSNYKGNLLRHMKSVHHRNIESEDGGSPTPPPPAISNVSTPSPESLVVKLEPCEEKISLTEDPPPSSVCSPVSPADVSVTSGSRYCQASGTPAPAPSPPVSPAATPRPEASAHT